MPKLVLTLGSGIHVLSREATRTVTTTVTLSRGLPLWPMTGRQHTGMYAEGCSRGGQAHRRAREWRPAGACPARLSGAAPPGRRQRPAQWACGAAPSQPTEAPLRGGWAAAPQPAASQALPGGRWGAPGAWRGPWQAAGARLQRPCMACRQKAALGHPRLCTLRLQAGDLPAQLDRMHRSSHPAGRGLACKTVHLVTQVEEAPMCPDGM